MTVKQLRDEFPILQEQVYGKQLVYLDNAATSQRPRAVVDKFVQMSLKANANIHRAVHRLSSVATDEYEAAREAVRAFIGAPSRRSIVFTPGATAALNLVAFSFGEYCLGEGDEIVVSGAEHHSDIVPWQMACERKGARLRVLPVLEDGRLDLAALPALLTPRTRLVCVTHISNVLGIVNPVGEIVKICHTKGCPVLIDGAQGVVHERVDVSALGCDFYVFSGHKIYAATGTGVLYAAGDWLDRLPPFMGGGDMIDTVTFEKTSYAQPPMKFEAGTQNVNAVPTWVPALAMAARMLSDGELAAQARAVKDFVLDALRADPRIRLFGDVADAALKAPIFSFTVDGAHHEDLALILDKMGVAVRSGHMCAEPLMARFGVTGMLRASFAPYNTMEEAEYFLKSLSKAIDMLR